MFNINKINEYKPAEVAKGNQNSDYKFQLFLTTIRIFGYIFLECCKWVMRLFKEKKKPVPISGQLALVTGGGNGLGRALCFRLAQEGCDVAIVDIDIKNASKTASEIRDKFKVNCKSFQCDISNIAAISKLKNDVENEMRGVDILVNNAGLLYMDDFIKSNVEDIQKVVQVNLTSQIMVNLNKFF